MAKIVVFGDIKTKGQAISVDPHIQDLCENADLVIANLEGPVIDNAKPRKDKRGNPLASDMSITSLTESLSIKLLTFGNNHILDFGAEGLEESISFAESKGIAWVGATDGKGNGSYVMINEELKVALFSFAHREGPVSEVDSGTIGPFVLPDFQRLIREISELSNKGYSVLISYHGGEEFFNSPWPRRIHWAKELTDAGALLVFGQHSHSVQPVYVTKNGGFLAPGLGNTYFDTPYQRRHTGTEHGIFLLLDTHSKTLITYSLHAKWKESYLGLDVVVPDSPVTFNEDELVAGWVADCKRKVFGNRLNVRCKQGTWLRSVVVSCYFFIGIVKGKFKSTRDVDILLGSIPVVGSYLAKKMLNSSINKFDF